MIRINLIAAESIKKQERNEILVLAYLVVVIVFVALGARYMTKFGNYRKLEARLAQAEQELGKLQNVVTQVDAIQAAKTGLETRKNVIGSLMATRLVYPKYLEEMALLMPANVWFKSMVTQSQAEGKLAVALDAESLDNYSIADFIATLSENPDFSNVELGPINTVTANKVTSSAFRLNFVHQKRSK